MHDLFIGSIVSSIGVRGDLPLGTSFCTTIQSRAARDDLFVGLDACTGCIVVQDRFGMADRYHRDEADALRRDQSAALRDGARRRSVGLVAQTRLDGRGRICVAPWMWARRGVAHRTLLVGMGDHFEVWNLDHVLEHGPGELRMLALLHLTPLAKDLRHEPALPFVEARRGTRRVVQPGIPVQPLPALRAGSDPLVLLG